MTGEAVTGAGVTGAGVTGEAVTGSKEIGAAVTGVKVTGEAATGGVLTGATVTGEAVTGAAVTGTKVTGAAVTGAKVTGEFVTGATVIGGAVTGEVVFGGKVTREAVTGAVVIGATVGPGTTAPLGKRTVTGTAMDTATTVIATKRSNQNRKRFGFSLRTAPACVLPSFSTAPAAIDRASSCEAFLSLLLMTNFVVAVVVATGVPIIQQTVAQCSQWRSSGCLSLDWSCVVSRCCLQAIGVLWLWFVK